MRVAGHAAADGRDSQGTRAWPPTGSRNFSSIGPGFVRRHGQSAASTSVSRPAASVLDGVARGREFVVNRFLIASREAILRWFGRFARLRLGRLGNDLVEQHPLMLLQLDRFGKFQRGFRAADKAIGAGRSTQRRRVRAGVRSGAAASGDLAGSGVFPVALLASESLELPIFVVSAFG